MDHTEIWQSIDYLGTVDVGAQVILSFQRKPEITQDYLGTVTYGAQVILRFQDFCSPKILGFLELLGPFLGLCCHMPATKYVYEINLERTNRPGAGQAVETSSGLEDLSQGMSRLV